MTAGPIFERVVVLTGAGISAELGVSTFRDKDGIWSKYDLRDVATPEGFRRNPSLVLDFYNTRRRAHAGIRPNAAHHALARLERELKGQVTIVTQNIDALHEAAGSKNLIHMHGELMQALCASCGARHRWSGDIATEHALSLVQRSGRHAPGRRLVRRDAVPHG